MATANLDGTGADFIYTPVGGTQTTHLLAVKLLISPANNFSATSKQRFFAAWSADGTVRETFTIGTQTDQIEVQFRYDDEPDSLRSMLEEGLHNYTTITYRPTGSGGNTYPLKVVQVGGSSDPGDVRVIPDPDRFAFAEYMASAVLRRVDGTDLSGLF